MRIKPLHGGLTFACVAGWLCCVRCVLLPVKISDHLLGPYRGIYKKLDGINSDNSIKAGSLILSPKGRSLLQTCSANTYSYNGACYPCANGSTSNAGSSGFASCICNVPTYRVAHNTIYGKSGSLGTDSGVYSGIFVIMNYIFPQNSASVGTVITSWTVTTVKACTIQPFYTGASNDKFFENPTSSQQLYYIIGMTDPVVIPGAGTYTFPWTNYAARGGNSLSSANSMSLGWYDVSGSGNCISTFKSTSASQTVANWAPLSPLWQDGYYNNYGGFKADVALQINSNPSGVPSVMACNNCPQNQYYVSNTQCNACPANSVSPAGSPSIDSCVCPVNMVISNSNCACAPNYYLSGATCTTCPGNTASPAASTSVSNCACNALAISINSTYCVCTTGTFGDISKLPCA
jgi:hypothetical protein